MYMSNFKRSNSSIYTLRIFHNWVKNELFRQVQNYLIADGVEEFSILELAVGRGGDLFKWQAIGAKEVYGFDIDKESVTGKNGAYHRYSRLRKNKSKKVPYCKFYVMDLTKPLSFEKMKKIIGGKKFHIVSCQFAMHYFFRDKESFNNFTNIVNYFIHDYGYFIGTTMNSDMLFEKLKTSKILKGEIFEIEKKYDNKDPILGRTYAVALGEKGEDHYFRKNASIEYLADIETLSNKFSTMNIGLREVKVFEDWYDLYEQQGPETLMDEKEKQFSFLNLSTVYQKFPDA